jgi:hypothetical protein
MTLSHQSLMKFNETQFARDYEERMTAEGYPGSLLDTVARELAGLERVIDIGAGTGLFALPLAGAGHLVTAVEPSHEMVSIMLKKMDDDTSRRVGIHECSWEESRGQMHDAALCAHSIYGMADARGALEKMKSLAGRTVLLVRDDAASTTLSGIVKSRAGINRCAKDFIGTVSSALEGLGIPYRTERLSQERTSRFSDMDAEAAYYARHTGAGEENLELIISVLRGHVTRDGGWYRFNNIYHDVMFVF